VRHIILHHHIFKNAGTTLDYSLKRQFCSGFVALDDPSGNLIDSATLVHFLDQNPDVKAVSSHHFHGQDFLIRGYRFFNLALIRSPLHRLLSIYKFSLRSEGELADIAKTSDLPVFLRILIERYPHLVDSPQTNMFANHGFYGRPTGMEDFRNAAFRLQSFSLCAPVERYDDAMVALEYFISPVYGPKGLDFSYVRQNVSEPIEGQTDLRGLIGADYDHLAKLSEQDEMLCSFANNELDGRLLKVPNLPQRQLGFHRRCLDLVDTQ
jgi:hypothetical protein